MSPVDGLSLLIEFLTISANRTQEPLVIDKYSDDDSGAGTITVFKNSLQVLNRMTGNTPGSLGLRPAIYFYNERGKYIRFLFLGMTTLVADKLRNNDQLFFRTLIILALTNMSKAQRTSKMRDLFMFLVDEAYLGRELTAEAAIANMGLRGRILDVNTPQSSPYISDDTKTMVFMQPALKKALPCPMCKGLLDPVKSASYDHITPVRDGGTGDLSNTQLVHPYCNSSEINKESAKKTANPEP